MLQATSKLPGERRLWLTGRTFTDPALRTFRWQHPRKTIATTKAKTFLDSGTEYLLELKTLHTDPPCHGSGRLVPRRNFVEWLNKPHQMQLVSA